MSDPSMDAAARRMAAQAGLTVEHDSTYNVRAAHIAKTMGKEALRGAVAGMAMNEGLLKFANDSVPTGQAYSGDVEYHGSVSVDGREEPYSGTQHYEGDAGYHDETPDYEGTVPVDHSVEYTENGEVVGSETQTREISYFGSEHFSGDDADWKPDESFTPESENTTQKPTVDILNVMKMGVLGGLGGAIQGLFNINKAE